MKRKFIYLFITISLFVSGYIMSGCNDTSSSNIISETTTSNENSSSTIIEAKNNFYSNPIYPLVNEEKAPTYMADPYVLKADDGYFYLYCTQTEVYRTDNLLDGRVFTRGPVFKSTNAVDWKYVSNVFDSYVPDWGTSGAGVWAPTVLKIGNYYNFYYSLSTGGDSNPGIGVARSETPYGPFEHYGKLFNSEEIGVTNSIDPYVFIDDGKVYMAFGSFGGLITLIQLSNDGLSLYGGLENQYNNKVALAGFEVVATTNYEGTIILKRNGYYYLFLSTGTCCSGANSTYHVVVARSKTLTGPYLDANNKDMFHPNNGSYVVTPSMSYAMGVGHNGLISDDLGDVWMFYHGYDVSDSSYNKGWRVPYLDKLLWDNNGFPYVENYHASNHEIKSGPYLNTLEEGVN